MPVLGETGLLAPVPEEETGLLVTGLEEDLVLEDVSMARLEGTGGSLISSERSIVLRTSVEEWECLTSTKTGVQREDEADVSQNRGPECTSANFEIFRCLERAFRLPSSERHLG